MSHLVARPNLLGGLALAAVVAVLPLVLGDFRLSIMVFIAIFALATMGLCLLMGYAGQVSLGHAAFFGLGAYASALLSTRLGWNPWLAMLLAALGTAAVAYLIGIPILRLRGHYLAMATLGLGIIVHIGQVELVELTGGPSGFPGIPYLSVGDFAFDRDLKFYYLAWGALLAATAVALNVVNSRVGRALRAIHGSELAAATLGVDTARYKVQVFALSAAYASLAGSLYAHYVTFISPAPFGFGASIELLVMATVGGLASIWGAIFGAAAVTLLTELIRDLLPSLLGKTGGEQEIIVFGLILMLVMIFLPEGLTRGVLDLVRRRTAPRAVSPDRQAPADSAASDIARELVPRPEIAHAAEAGDKPPRYETELPHAR